MSTFKSDTTQWIAKIITKIEQLFYGTLGTWNTYPVDFDLKDDGKPICSRAYLVLKVHEEMFKKEVEFIVLLGFLKVENDSEWVSPSFAQPKPKLNRVCFLSNFRNLNKQLKPKPYPMLKINKMLLELEVF